RALEGQGRLVNLEGLGETLIAMAGTALGLIVATVAATIGGTRTAVNRRLGRGAVAGCIARRVLVVARVLWRIGLVSGLGPLRAKPAPPAGPVPTGGSMRRDTL